MDSPLQLRISQDCAPDNIHLSITDVNNCTVSETFDLSEPARFSMTIESSLSRDGQYNIDCYGASTGYVNITPVNNVGEVDYLWIDGFLGSRRPEMSAGTFKIILTDSNSCHADSTVTLTEPDPIKITFDLTDPFCPDSPDGEIRTNCNRRYPRLRLYLSVA